MNFHNSKRLQIIDTKVGPSYGTRYVQVYLNCPPVYFSQDVSSTSLESTQLFFMKLSRVLVHGRWPFEADVMYIFVKLQEIVSFLTH